MTTTAGSAITKYAATLGGTFVDASSTPTEVGFQYGTSTAFGSSTAASTVATPFSASLSGLSAGTTYYYRAYAVVGGETFTGSTLSLTTLDAVVGKYKGCIEMPLVATTYVNDTYTAEPSGYGYRAYKHTVTGNSRQSLVNHTFQLSSVETRNYSILYDETKYCALWVAYPMHTKWTQSLTTRKDNFRQDPSVSTTYQASSTYSGYSRGHQIASADRLVSSDANSQTFFYSNMTPQEQTFNGGKWAGLEEAVRTYTPSAQNDTLYVVSGAIFDSGYSLADSKYPIPTRYYKALVRCRFTSGEVTSASGIAFIMTHTDTSTAYTDCAVSISALEGVTGFSYFDNLPDALRSGVKSNQSLPTFSSFCSN